MNLHTIKHSGRLTGQAFVEFEDIDSLEAALARDKQHMGKRYLEIERSDEKTLRKMTESAGANARACFIILPCVCFYYSCVC